MAQMEAGNDQGYWSASPGMSDYDAIGLLADEELIMMHAYEPAKEHFENPETCCKNNVLLVFPDICPDYLEKLTIEHQHGAAGVISAILDMQERGENYPIQAALESRSRKRKRTSGSHMPGYNLDSNGDRNDDANNEGRDTERVRSIKQQLSTREYAVTMACSKYIALARTLLGQDFPRIPQTMIRHFLSTQKSVFRTYIALDAALRGGDVGQFPRIEKKTSTKIKPEFTPNGIMSLNLATFTLQEQAAISELMAAREIRAMKDADIGAEIEEKANFQRAQAEGQTTECGICYEECPFNRMVRCEGEVIHWFCRKCLRSQAESQIGLGRYELTCMCMDGCEAGFSQAQKALFLNKKLTVVLDRIEAEANLRMAGIENLETCPFCPYAAEYPPVELDKEFRCEDPDCQQVSCRLCRKETHIPKTCAEAAADRGLETRHILEEAMTAALIRRCNKCQSPFVKQDGCNKIACTKCGTVQCDVCRKTIKDYTHFNDPRRGGKAGQCPLFDEAEKRYEAEVSKAEEEMQKKVTEGSHSVGNMALDAPFLNDKNREDNKRSNGLFFAQNQLPPNRPRPAFLERVRADDVIPVEMHRLEADVPRAHIAPKDLQLQQPQNPLKDAARNLPANPFFLGQRGAGPPSPVTRLNDRMDHMLKAVQQAMRQKDRPVPLRMAGIGPAGAMALQPGFRNVFMGEQAIEANPQPIRSHEGAIQYQDMGHVNPGLMPQPNTYHRPNHAQMVDRRSAPFMLQAGSPFPGLAGVPPFFNNRLPLPSPNFPGERRMELAPAEHIFDESVFK